MPLHYGKRYHMKLPLTDSNTGKRLSSQVVVTINFEETANFSKIVSQEIYENQVWSWSANDWVPKANGAYSVPRKPGKIGEFEAAGFDECEAFENERLEGGVERFKVAGSDWHMNAIAGGEAEAWLYAASFSSEVGWAQRSGAAVLSAPRSPHTTARPSV